MAGLFAVAASVAAGVAFYSWQQATFAEVAAETARDEAQLGDSFFRALQARNELEDDLPILAMHLALAGLPEDPMSPSARPWVGETGGVLIAALGATRETGVLGSHEGTVWAAGFSPEGDRIVSGSSDATVRVWDVTSGEEFLVLHGHEGTVWAAGFSPSGDRIVSGAEDSTVLVAWIDRSKEELIASACRAS